MTIKLTDVSRVLSHALRHAPWVYELELDDEGWVSVEDILVALRSERSQWRALSVADLERMMAEATKQRFEMAGGRIRAFYGHSLPARVARVASAPPAVLYHGTSPQTAALIRASGLLPMGRQYVHLSVDVETAEQVGRRKGARPTILRVDAEGAHAAGVAFYHGNEMVWLADRVPAEFIGGEAEGGC